MPNLNRCMVQRIAQQAQQRQMAYPETLNSRNYRQSNLISQFISSLSVIQLTQA